jgi:hypothetical protein
MSNPAMPPADFFMDVLHYNSKVHPEEDRLGTWPISTVLTQSQTHRQGTPRLQKYSATNTTTSIAPSVSLYIRQMCHSSAARSEIAPLPVPIHPLVAAANEVWKELLLSNVIIHTKDGGKALVPKSHAVHDNLQLQYNRRSTATNALVPSCSCKGGCDALEYKNATEPLQIYFTPEQQTRFNQTGECAAGPGFCLLCIRRDATSREFQYKAMLMTPHAQCSTENNVIPPFTNLVDVPGGYNKGCFCVLATTSDTLPVNIVGTSGEIVFRTDSVTNNTYFDQSALIFGGPLNA